jgi:hypothetical protein
MDKFSTGDEHSEKLPPRLTISGQVTHSPAGSAMPLASCRITGYPDTESRPTVILIFARTRKILFWNFFLSPLFQ